MIFADKLVEQEPRLTKPMLEKSRMVRIHPDVHAAASHLIEQGIDKIEKVAPFAVWPDHETWIEGQIPDEDGFGAHYGFLFYGGIQDKSVTAGHGLAVLQRSIDAEAIYIPVYYDLAKFEMKYKNPVNETEAAMAKLAPSHPLQVEYTQAMAGRTRSGNDFEAQMTLAPILKMMKPLLFTLLALMNSPKLVRQREHDHAKLNPRRIKRGKYPYYPHHEVVLNIDKHSFMVTQGQGDGPERGLHFVRSHLRFLVHPRYKNVEVSIVQPHWRGNPELGIRNTSYAMAREKSKWTEKVE